MKVKKICFIQKRKVVIEESDLNEYISSNQILCKTLYTLISPGTESALYTETHIGFKDPNDSSVKYPFYPGYLNVARIERTGTKVKNFSPGQLIFTLQPHCSAFILEVNHETKAVLLPENIDPMLATFSGMATIASTASFMAPASRDKSVCVFGMGIIGNLAAQTYKLKGARVIGIDLNKNRLEFARKCDLATYLSDLDCKWQSDFHNIHGCPDIVIEATGNSKLIESALMLTGEMGKVVLLGSPRTTSVIDTYSLIHKKGASLIGAHSRVIPDWKAVMEQTLQKIALKKLIVEPLITHKCYFEEAHEAYEAYANGNSARMGTLLNWH